MRPQSVFAQLGLGGLTQPFGFMSSANRSSHPG